MAIIITGGTGKTGIRIAALLKDAKLPFVITSRKGAMSVPDMPVAKFEWGDPSTFPNPFREISEKVSAIYLVGPQSTANPAASVNAFVDYAIKEHGVRRFVLAGGTLLTKGGEIGLGKVWTHLEEVGVDYAVLRLTWFMDNFSESFKSVSIKDENKIYTATGDAQIPFVSARDIAAVGFRLLVDEKPPTEVAYRVVGPEMLTHDQVAAKLSQCLGRKIEHIELSETEGVAFYMKGGMPEAFAKFLVNLEVQTKNGLEGGVNDTVQVVTGQPGLKFDDWALQNKACWG